MRGPPEHTCTESHPFKVGYLGQPTVQHLCDAAAINGLTRTRDHMGLDAPHLDQTEYVYRVALTVLSAHVTLSFLGLLIAIAAQPLLEPSMFAPYASVKKQGAFQFL